VWRKATGILDRQARESAHAGPVEARLHREARFVMAALADEVFIHPRWEGTDYWLAHLLESRYFQTHSAGESFFSNASALLTLNDPSADQLVLVYLMALALGFRGQYAGRPEGDTVIRELRERLLETIWRRHPGMLNDTRHLFPDAGHSTVREGPIRKLPSPSKWVSMALAAVVLWVLISWLPWRALSGPLYDKLSSGTATVVTAPEGGR
jgi:type VI secretion system protein ImpK